MILLLIQHGEAVEKATDPDRPLTVTGREDVRRVASFAQAAGVSVSEVWHSGKTRAAQTARLVAEQIAPQENVIERAGLKPNDDVKQIACALGEMRGDGAIVGHLPHLSRLAAFLLTGSDGKEVVAFQRGGIVALQRNEEGAWQLIWALPPNLIARR